MIQIFCVLLEEVTRKLALTIILIVLTNIFKYFYRLSATLCFEWSKMVKPNNPSSVLLNLNLMKNKLQTCLILISIIERIHIQDYSS